MDALFESVFGNPTLILIYQIARAIGVVLDIVFAVILVYALVKLWHYRPNFVWDPRKWHRYVKPEKKKPAVKSPLVTAAWKKVQGRLQEASPESLRLAVIEADGAGDEALKGMGAGGETFADRLGSLSAEKYPTIEAVWEAHRLRNNLVHTPDFQMGAAKAESAIHAYEAFLKDIKAL